MKTKIILLLSLALCGCEFKARVHVSESTNAPDSLHRSAAQDETSSLALRVAFTAGYAAGVGFEQAFFMNKVPLESMDADVESKFADLMRKMESSNNP